MLLGKESWYLPVFILFFIPTRSKKLAELGLDTFDSIRCLTHLFTKNTIRIIEDLEYRVMRMTWSFTTTAVAFLVTMRLATTQLQATAKA
jgi:hypothetical protein